MEATWGRPGVRLFVVVASVLGRASAFNVPTNRGMLPRRGLSRVSSERPFSTTIGPPTLNYKGNEKDVFISALSKNGHVSTLGRIGEGSRVYDEGGPNDEGTGVLS